jgi:hypothetical protein
VAIDADGIRTTYGRAAPEAFAVISGAWVRSGWVAAYTSGFTWLGRPLIRLAQDLIRAPAAFFQTDSTPG